MQILSPFTDVWNTNVEELSIDFEISVGHPSGSVTQAVEYICLKFSKGGLG